jgi:hypothetical protein
LTITFLLTLTATFGQTKFEPQILILSPYEAKYEKVFEKEISLINKSLKKNSKSKEHSDFLKSNEFEKQPENIKLMTKAEVEFSKNLDLFKQASFISEQYLAYRFYERFPQVLILLSENKSKGDVSSLMSYSKSTNLQYVLNFSKIELFQKNEISFANVSIQLYDNISNSILIDKTYEGDWNNPGFDFACNDSTINCSINNALSKALGEIIYIIASNNPTLKKQKQLSQERSEILATTYLYRPFDNAYLNNIISKTDSSINTSNLFQCIVSEDKTKFVAFFIEQISKQDFKSLKDSKKDKSINVISSKDIKDEGFLDDVPQTYAYIVTGVLHNNKWYYEKKNVTYFEAKSLDDGKQKYFNNLQKWNFFKENLVDVNADFWETYFFSRIESSVEANKKKIDELKLSLTQSKDKEEKAAYQDMIDDFYERDLKNQGYFGLYTIVADELRKEKRKQDEAFVDKVKNQVLNGFYESNSKKNGIERFVKMNGKEYPLIFPSDKSVLLSPIVIDYGSEKLELNYFVLIPNSKDNYDIYKWTFFKPIKPQYNSMYGQEVNKQLNEVTKWNFSFDTLDDKNFWDKYVLLKEGDSYKYLKPAQ